MLQVIYEAGAAYIGIKFTPNLVKIDKLVQKLKWYTHKNSIVIPETNFFP
jgi:hypothetical protein